MDIKTTGKFSEYTPGSLATNSLLLGIVTVFLSVIIALLNPDSEVIVIGFMVLAAVIIFSDTLINRFYNLFIVLTLTTEFYYIHVAGGILRPYHFIAIIVVLCLIKQIPNLLSSRAFLALMVFVAINIVAVGLSNDPNRAFKSIMLLFANITVAIAMALSLISGKISLSSLKRIILMVTLVGIVWGLVQIMVFRLTGFVLALSEEQATQIKIGLAPVFRTEADTFGKYMVLPFMLFLPEYIEHRTLRNINIIYVMFLIGILMNFIRTPIYGTGLALVFVFYWYVRSRKAQLVAKKAAVMIMVVAFGVILMMSGLLPVSEYALHKISTIANQEEILEGGSSGYRLLMMGYVIEETLSSRKKQLIGNGWGQTHVDFNGEEVQAGGGDLVNIFGYSGILGVIIYLAYTLIAFVSMSRVARSCKDDLKARFAEGVVFSIVGIFCTAQMASYLITPEYWLLIGVIIFLTVKSRGSDGSITVNGMKHA